MPQGYDNRQPPKESFAFTGPKPVQAGSALSGRSGQFGVSGGQAQSGEFGDHFTPGGSVADSGLPQFLEKAMQPYIQRKQDEAVLSSMTNAAAGETLDQVKTPEK